MPSSITTTAAPSTPAAAIPIKPPFPVATTLPAADLLVELVPLVVVEALAEHKVPFLELSISTLGWPLVIPIERPPSEPTVYVLHETASMTVVPEDQPEDEEEMVRLEEVEPEAPRLERMEIRGCLATRISLVDREETLIWQSQWCLHPFAETFAGGDREDPSTHLSRVEAARSVTGRLTSVVEVLEEVVHCLKVSGITSQPTRSAYGIRVVAGEPEGLAVLRVISTGEASPASSGPYNSDLEDRVTHSLP
jgi:hypothetical protein